MKELIKIDRQEVAGKSIQTVNARDLHAFLESKQQFADWIKNRIKKYSFTENADFTVIHNSMNNHDGRPAVDYHLSLDMAKELSMVERNAKGKEARLYFIECERVALQAPAVDPIKVLNDPAAMRGLLLTYSEKVLSLEATVAEQAPKVEALDRIAGADGLHNITNTAKALQVKPSALFSWLSANQWIYRRVGGKSWVAYQQRIQQGFLTHKVHTVVSETDGTAQVYERVMVTAKGMAKLSGVFSLNAVGRKAA